jgi:hypothetical protein
MDVFGGFVVPPQQKRNIQFKQDRFSVYVLSGRTGEFLIQDRIKSEKREIFGDE